MDQIVFVDANIFLEIFLKNSKIEDCKNFLEKSRLGNISAFTSDFIVYTCLIQIQCKTKELNTLKDFVIFINTLNLNILKLNIANIPKTIEFMSKYNLDFDDALVVSFMKDNHISNLISYDKDFDKVNIIKREEPSRYLLKEKNDKSELSNKK